MTADGAAEKEVIDRLFREVRDRLRNLILTGASVPRPRPIDEPPASAAVRKVRRLLLVIN